MIYTNLNYFMDILAVLWHLQHCLDHVYRCLSLSLFLAGLNESPGLHGLFSYYPYFYTLKCHLRVISIRFSLFASHARILYVIQCIFSGSMPETISIFNPKSLTVKLVLLSQPLSCLFSVKFLASNNSL